MKYGLAGRLSMTFILMMAGVSLPALSQDVTFNAVLSQGTCTVSVSDINLGSAIATTALPTAAWGYLDLGGGARFKTFDVTLSGCAGIAPGGITPALTITGAHDGLTGGSEKFIFRKTDAIKTASSGVGFAIFKDETGPAANQEVSDSGLDATAKRYIDLGSAGSVPTSGTIKHLSTGLGCGAQKCSEVLRAGTVHAEVTFNFVYH